MKIQHIFSELAKILCICTFLRRLPSAVECVAYSPDGKTLVSGSADNTLRQWDALTGEPFGSVLNKQEGGERWGRSIYCVSYSPSGIYLVSGGSDTCIRQWVAATGKPFGPVLSGHTEWNNADGIRMAGIHIVDYSPSGTHLASSGCDGTIRQWVAATGESFGPVLNGNRVTYSRDGEILLITTTDGLVRQWVAATGKPVGPKMPIESVCYSPTGSYLAGISRNTVRQWVASTGEPFGPEMQDSNYVTSICYSPTGLYLAGAKSDGTVCQWVLSTGESFGPKLMGHSTRHYTRISYSPTGMHLVSAGADCRICVWNSGVTEDFSLVWITRSEDTLLITTGLRLSGVLGLRADQIALLAYAGCTETESVVPVVRSTAVVSYNSSSFFNQNEHDRDELSADETSEPSTPGR